MAATLDDAGRGDQDDFGLPDPGSDEKGIIAAYFDDLEIGGFAVHLRRRLDA